MICLALGIAHSSDERPLTEQERKKFKLLRVFMIDNLCLESIVEMLFSNGCINYHHKDKIMSLTTKREKISWFLDIIERRSMAKFRLFVCFLRETGQNHVAFPLESNGGCTSSNSCTLY